MYWVFPGTTKCIMMSGHSIFNGVEVHGSRPKPRQGPETSETEANHPIVLCSPNQKAGSVSELPSPLPTHPSSHKSYSGPPNSSLCSPCTLRDRRVYGKGCALWSSTAWCQSWLDLVAVWPRASLLTALDLSFHIQEEWIITAVITEGCEG